jgi:hypothetical protein
MDKMDRCDCWTKTQIVIDIEHCPSVYDKIKKELDKIILFTMKESMLSSYGKVGVHQTLGE